MESIYDQHSLYNSDSFCSVRITFLSQETGTIKGKTVCPVVDVMIAKKVNVPTNIEVNGSALSEEMIELYPEVGGRLIYLNIPDGASVTAGTVLAKINDADLQAQLEQQKVQLELAVKTEQRLKQLLAVNGVNQSDYDAALSQVNTIQANIKVLKHRLIKQLSEPLSTASWDYDLSVREHMLHP